jgi:hypothetical protein
MRAKAINACEDTGLWHATYHRAAAKRWPRGPVFEMFGEAAAAACAAPIRVLMLEVSVT